VPAQQHVDHGVGVEDIARGHASTARRRSAARASSSCGVNGSRSGSKSGVTRPKDERNPVGQRRFVFGSISTRSPEMR
jgi:hypothetical protein